MAKNKREYLSDFWTLDDDLHFDVFKRSLLNIIRKADTPLTIGVFGNWGSGKTTLLQMLKSESSKDPAGKIKTIWFTAWKYGQQEALWRAFMLRVIDGLFPKSQDGNRINPSQITDPNLYKGVQYLERLERSIYETVHWQEEGNWNLDFGEFAKQSIKIPVWLAFHFAGMGNVAKELGINPELATLVERNIREHHLNQLVSIEQFADEFEKAICLILGEEGRLVVFVDDLDRCLPEKSLEVLESIKLFLDVPRTVFVLGMDREVIKRGIETYYGSLLEIVNNRKELPVNGDIYLQKMIQIPFNLPPLDINARRNYILNLEKKLSEEFNLDEITLDVFARGVLPNPRQIKRALNVFYLLKSIGVEQEKQKLIPDGFLSWPLLAKTVLIQSQWPELYQIWRQYPTLIQILEEEYTVHPLSETMILQGNFDIDEKSVSANEVRIRQSNRKQFEATGLLSEYLNNRHKYPLLADMLSSPFEEQKGRRTAKFAGLTRSQVQIYVGLVGAVEGETEVVPDLNLTNDLLQILESGDLVRIQEVISNVNEKEVDQDGPQHQRLGKHLVNISQNPAIALPARYIAAKSVNTLNYLPKDLYKFLHVPLPKSKYNLFVGKYPVTNLQYKRFVESSSFMDKSTWSDLQVFTNKNIKKTIADDGWKWVQEQAKQTDSTVIVPEVWNKEKTYANWQLLPVTSISWWEASAYCRWLFNNWGQLEETDANVDIRPSYIRLPVETEWIHAAGGSEPDKRYPWDIPGEVTIDEYEIQKRSNIDNKLGVVTPVNMYPLGESPLGVRDMCGNTLEWQANYKHEDEGLITLRGSTWFQKHEIASVSAGVNSAYINDRLDYIGFRIAVIIEDN